MIVVFDIEPVGDLSPVMVAHQVGNSIGLPFEVVGTINNDELVHLNIEIESEHLFLGYNVKEPFNQED